MTFALKKIMTIGVNIIRVTIKFNHATEKKNREQKFFKGGGENKKLQKSI